MRGFCVDQRCVSCYKSKEPQPRSTHVQRHVHLRDQARPVRHEGHRGGRLPSRRHRLDQRPVRRPRRPAGPHDVDRHEAGRAGAVRAHRRCDHPARRVPHHRCGHRHAGREGGMSYAALQGGIRGGPKGDGGTPRVPPCSSADTACQFCCIKNPDILGIFYFY